MRVYVCVCVVYACVCVCGGQVSVYACEKWMDECFREGVNVWGRRELGVELAE